MKKLVLIMVFAAIVGSVSAVAVTPMEIDVPATSPFVTVNPTGGPNGESAWETNVPAGANYVWNTLYWAEDESGVEIDLQFTVANIDSISYWTKDMDTTDVKDWYLHIYTKDTGTGDFSSWYHSLHTAEPGYGSAGMPSGQWTQWTTDLNGGLLFNENSLNPGTMLLSELDGSLEVLGIVLKAGDTGAGWDYTGSLSTANILLNGSTMGALDMTYNFVPEPMTMVLLAGGSLLALRRRK